MSGVAAGCLGHSTLLRIGDCGLRIRNSPFESAIRNPQSAIRLPPMIALARKYRPKKFSDLLVQDHVAAALRGAVAGGRVAHGYLFAGPRGGGETTAARIPAMAPKCERRGGGGRGGGAGGRGGPCAPPPAGGPQPG